MAAPHNHQKGQYAVETPQRKAPQVGPYTSQDNSPKEPISAINARCDVSQQSIAEGDFCRVMFLSQSSSYKPLELQIGDRTETQLGTANATVYPNCYWSPKSPFIRAGYVDYGMTKLVLETLFDRAKVTHLFATLFQESVNTQAGENRFHDLAYNFAQFIREIAPILAAALEPSQEASPSIRPSKNELNTELQKCWDYLSDMARRRRTFTCGRFRHIRPMELFIVHERAYQALADDMAKHKDWDGISFELNGYFRHALDAAHTAAASNSLAQEDADEEQHAAARASAFIESLSTAIARLDIDNCTADNVARHAYIREVRRVFAGESSDAEFISKAADWTQDRLVICGMEMLEIKFAPLAYVGADLKNSVGSAYSRLISQISKKVTADRQRLKEK